MPDDDMQDYEEFQAFKQQQAQRAQNPAYQQGYPQQPTLPVPALTPVRKKQLFDAYMDLWGDTKDDDDLNASNTLGVYRELFGGGSNLPGGKKGEKTATEMLFFS